MTFKFAANMVMAFAISFIVTTSADAAPRSRQAPVEQSVWSFWSTPEPVAERRARPSRAAQRNDRSERSSRRASSYESPRSSSGVGPRPRQWCGWYMRTQLGGGPEFNLAANWRRYGSAGSPQVGAVVVWPHHVGIITGRASNGQWIVKSGNYSNRVHEGPRSISGATVRV
jgi:surface antigen